MKTIRSFTMTIGLLSIFPYDFLYACVARMDPNDIVHAVMRSELRREEIKIRKWSLDLSRSTKQELIEVLIECDTYVNLAINGRVDNISRQYANILYRLFLSKYSIRTLSLFGLMNTNILDQAESLRTKGIHVRLLLMLSSNSFNLAKVPLN